MSKTKYQTNIDHLPVFDYADGEIHFVSIINKHYQRPLTKEVKELFAKTEDNGYMLECDLQALIRWLKREQDNLQRDIDVSLMHRRVILTNSLRAAVSIRQ